MAERKPSRRGKSAPKSAAKPAPRKKASAPDPNKLLAELAEEFGERLNPAVEAALGKYGAISKWLAASPENAAAFKSNPVRAIRDSFPELEFRGGARVPPGASFSIAGLGAAPPDQATIDFFLEVWSYVAASAPNMSAFIAGEQSTIDALGAGKPAYVVQRVKDAFVRVNQQPDQGTHAGRVVGEEIFHQILDPIGPVESPGVAALTKFRAPLVEGGE